MKNVGNVLFVVDDGDDDGGEASSPPEGEEGGVLAVLPTVGEETKFE